MEAIVIIIVAIASLAFGCRMYIKNIVLKEDIQTRNKMLEDQASSLGAKEAACLNMAEECLDRGVKIGKLERELGIKTKSVVDLSTYIQKLTSRLSQYEPVVAMYKECPGPIDEGIDSLLAQSNALGDET